MGLQRLDPSIPDEGPVDGPDGKFFAFLGQAQWVYQLSDLFLDGQVVARTNLQLASDWLVSMERIAVGGAFSVRGYRENALVRDNGWISSLELRIPVELGLPGSSRLELASFVDVGLSWNDRETPRDELKTLASVGVGLRYSLAPYLSSELYWGGRLSSTDGFAPQGHGLHIQITASLP